MSKFLPQTAVNKEKFKYNLRRAREAAKSNKIKLEADAQIRAEDEALNAQTAPKGLKP